MKLKISKKTGLVIAIGIFVIALGSLFTVYSGQADEKMELNGQLASVQSQLSGIQLEQLSSRQAELEEQLSQATPQFEAVKDILSQPVESVTVTSALFDLAGAYGVKVIEITSPSPTAENLEGVTCSVISLTARVEGGVPNLVGFITKLNSHFTTGIVKAVKITALETASSGNTSADIQLAVYIFQEG
ncbi:hypothetical protein ACFLUU_03210 [Chloroflexota bacterium]